MTCMRGMWRSWLMCVTGPGWYTLTRERGLALVITRKGVEAVVLPDLNDRQASDLAYAWFLAYQSYHIRNNPKDPDRIQHAAKALQDAMPRYEAAVGSGRAQALREMLAGIRLHFDHLTCILGGKAAIPLMNRPDLQK